jgi:hypothetical protein
MFLPVTDNLCGYTSDYRIGRHGPCYDGTGGNHAIITDRDTIQDGDFRSDPAVVADNNSFPFGSLFADDVMTAAEIMIFRMAAEIRTNDTIVTDFQSACATEVRELTDTDVMSDNDMLTRIIP